MNIKIELNRLRDEVRAENEKKYLKSPMFHYGVKVPELRSIAQKWVKENRSLTIGEIVDFCAGLWEQPSHEERMIAIFILQKIASRLTLDWLPVIDHLLHTATGWAQLDGIAGWICSDLYARYRPEMEKVISKWALDPNFWVRRAAVLSFMKPMRQGYFNKLLFEQLTVPMLGEKEFFIRKAIGWVLRDFCLTSPEVTLDYVKRYRSLMSGLTYREATRKLPLSYRTE